MSDTQPQHRTQPSKPYLFTRRVYSFGKVSLLQDLDRVCLVVVSQFLVDSTGNAFGITETKRLIYCQCNVVEYTLLQTGNLNRRRLIWLNWLARVGLAWSGLYRVSWTGLTSIKIRLAWCGLDRTGLDSTGFEWIELCWFGLNWTNCSWMDWTALHSEGLDEIHIY